MQLNDALNEWRVWDLSNDERATVVKTRPTVLEQFTAGLNHTTAKLQVGERVVVLKVFQGFAEQELAAQNWASQLRGDGSQTIAPKILYSDPQCRYAVMEFISGASLQPRTISEEILAHLGGVLRQLHTAEGGPAGREGFDIVRFCKHYLVDAGVEASRLHRQIAPFLLEYQRDQTPWCFCHNDLVAANMLVSGNRVSLIDWEFADLHNPWFDLAAVVYYLGLTNDQTDALLESYQRFRFDDASQRILSLAQIALLWGDMLWHLAKFGEGFWPQLETKKRDLMAFTAKLSPSGV